MMGMTRFAGTLSRPSIPSPTGPATVLHFCATAARRSIAQAAASSGAARRRNIGMLRGHNDELYGVAFSPDGRTIVSAGPDAVRLWNVATLREIAIQRTDAVVQGVAFSPDGQWLAGAANDGTVRLWHAPSFEGNSL